jgi:hypothetical protein
LIKEKQVISPKRHWPVLKEEELCLKRQYIQGGHRKSDDSCITEVSYTIEAQLLRLCALKTVVGKINHFIYTALIFWENVKVSLAFEN